jgi:uncharacterized membrane protein YoaK (UPF0700 family)
MLLTTATIVAQLTVIREIWIMQNKYVGIGLGFVAGYVDTVGFMSLFGLFTAHVTGNFVLIGSELAHPSHGVLIKLLAFPAFVSAVVLTYLVVSWLRKRERKVLVPILILQIAFLMAFMLFGSLAEPIQNANQLLALYAGSAGAAAMGIQNAASRLILSEIAPTTVMTGNVTQLVIDLMSTVKDKNSAISQRIGKFFWPVVAFAVGAISGAFTCVQWQFWSLLIPMSVLSLIAVCWNGE